MSATRYQVVCVEYRTKSAATREQAERLLASIEKDGHCCAEHRIEEVSE